MNGIKLLTPDDVESYAEWLGGSIVAAVGRSEAVKILVETLTSLGVVVFYYDDTVARRESSDLIADTPAPTL